MTDDELDASILELDLTLPLQPLTPLLPPLIDRAIDWFVCAAVVGWAVFLMFNV
jgi:hypothetical protein